jgi:hypothetical protein
MIRWAAQVSAAIGLVTVLSGGLQLALPAFVLSLLRADVTPTSAHFFRIVGMFMMLFGGLLLHVWWGGSAPRTATPVYWCAGQKAGAAGAVAWGVAQGLFAPLALAVAGFDLLSALVLYVYARSLA